MNLTIPLRVVTRWLIRNDTDWYQDRRESLVSRQEKCLDFGWDGEGGRESNGIAAQLSVNCSY